MSEGGSRDIVRRYFQYWNEGRMDDLQNLLDDDFKLLGMGTPLSGMNHVVSKQQLRDSTQKRANQFSKPITIMIDDIVGDGDHVVVQCRSSARLADGRDYANNYSFHFHLKNQKITQMEEYCCTYTAVKVLRESGVGL